MSEDWIKNPIVDYEEGDLIAVPLKSGGYGVALIARWSKTNARDFKRIICYGFDRLFAKMPTYDVVTHLQPSFMRFFLGAALFENSRLFQIAVIDPQLQVIESRARPLFAAPHLRDAFLPLPTTWEQVKYKPLIANRYQEALSMSLETFQASRAFQRLRAGDASG